MFCGRAQDLAVLEKAWSDATQPGGYPQIVVLLGDSGMGKTRLAQELYARIVETRDPTHYWPQALGQNGRNLNINPPLAACGTSVPSFLWWGLRFSDKTSRNAVAPSPLDSDLPVLAAHLARLARSLRDDERQKALLFRLLDFAADASIEFGSHAAELIPGVGAVKTAIKTGRSIERLRREHLADRPNLTLLELAERESREKSRRFAEIFASVMESKGDTLPVCILADDGHFSGPDSDAVDLIKNLLSTARTSRRWPLLLIVTFWPREWNEKASPLAEWLQTQAGNFKLHTLSKIGDLSPVLKARLPGLSTIQAKKLNERVDGNPEFLEDIITWLQIEVANFVARDRQRALTAKGFERVMTLARDRHKFAKQRIVDAGVPIRQVLSLGSSQGMRFLTDLVVDIAGKLNLTASPEAVQQAEKPHAFVVRDGILAEFAQRLYLEVAIEDLPNFADAEDVRSHLVAILKDRLDDTTRLNSISAKDRRATYSLATTVLPDKNDLVADAYARRAGIALIDDLVRSHEFQAAGLIAAQMVDRWIGSVDV